MSEASSGRAGHAPALAVALSMFLLVYGPELAHFSLSIDEELPFTAAHRSRAWLEQGRWGMALMAQLLPGPDRLPALHTLLFGAGLLAATWRALGDLRLRPAPACLFALVHVGFPLWLHIAEFNTLAAGFGLALAAAAFGSHLLLRADWRARLAGIALLAFSVSVYQTLWLYAILYCLLALHADWRAVGGAPTRWRETIPVALGLLAGLLFYFVVQRVWLAGAGLTTSYVGDYLQGAQLRADPLAGLVRALRYVAALLLGKHPIYLGWAWGAALLCLPWLGLWPWRARNEDAVARNGWLELGVLVLAIALVALPAVASLGALPARAYVAWPLLAAWLASRAGVLLERAGRPWWVLAMLGFAAVAGMQAATLWRADRQVHAADSELARELARTIRRVGGQTVPLPVALVGAFRPSQARSVPRVEAFGTSFFEHEGGNVHRVLLLLQREGFEGFEGVWLWQRPDLVQAQRAMPAWPAAGSVRRVEGVVVVKLGAPSANQLAAPGPITR